MFWLLAIALADPASGQLAETPPEMLSQTELRYPEGATEHADVTIQVSLDAAGAVLQVEVVEGPEVFHEAAIEAGHRLRFAPATRGGEPVHSTALVVFHFAPPHDESHFEGTGTIVVHAEDPDRNDVRARTTLDEADIEAHASDDLSETVDDVPGVTIGGGATDAGKPIIRGQTERRLLVLQDGIRHESQKWGADHATEIDPFAAGTISVIRGAAGTRYGPDAIGGVILVDPPEMRLEEGVGGRAVLAYNTNGQKPYGAVRLDRGGETALRVEGNYAIGAALSTPDYVLGNTASRVWNLGAEVQRDIGGSTVRLGLQHYDFSAGVFYGVSHNSLDELRESMELDRPVNADLWTTSYGIDRPYQAVTHDVISLHVDTPLDWGEAEFIYAFQLNRREEAEPARSSVTGPQYEFTLMTHSVDAAAQHYPFAWREALLEGGFGVQGGWQDNLYSGLDLLPNYRGLSGGIFAYERLVLAKVDIEVGARYDHLSRYTYMKGSDYERHERRGTLNATHCDVNKETDVAYCPKHYDAGTVSLGALWHVVPETLDWKFEASNATRFPNADELYLLGAAPTFPVYAIGYPDLGPETTWGASSTLGLRVGVVEAELSGFANRINDFVYFAPEFNENGVLHYDVTIRGAYPRYSYRPIDARFYGADGMVRLGPESVVGLDLSGSLVRAYDDQGVFLVGTPADRVRGRLSLRALERPGAPQVSVVVDGVAKQSRVDPELDFAPAPDGFWLMGVTASAEVRGVRVGVNGSNLMNVRYRDYNSLLRYTADAPGRDVRVHVATTF